MTVAGFDRITIDLKQMNGQPCVRGMRLTVRRVLEIIALYPDRADLSREFPELEEDDLKQVLEFAAANLDDETLDTPRRVKALILDRGLPRAATSLLRATSVEAVHVAELGMAAASDETILKYARDKSLVIVTLDADFHTQLALSGESTPSVIRLRVQGLKSIGAAELIQSVIIGRELSFKREHLFQLRRSLSGSNACQ